jgi:hypothetical protein
LRKQLKQNAVHFVYELFLMNIRKNLKWALALSEGGAKD